MPKSRPHENRAAVQILKASGWASIALLLAGAFATANTASASYERPAKQPVVQAP